MKSKILILLLCMLSPLFPKAQSTTTEALRKKHADALELFFYNNTLRMLNQADDKEFDDIIKDIEKMRFLMIKKTAGSFGSSDYQKLIADYKSEAFEEAMTSRHEGKNFDIYLKDKSGKTRGMLVLINDTSSLYVLDILGSVALDKVTKLYSTLDKSTDVGSKIKVFMGHGDGDDKTH